MLIGVFKSNQKLLTILVVALTALLWIPSFWFNNTIVIEKNSLFNLFSWALKLKTANFLFSVILISIQAIYLNNIVNELKLVKNNTHLPALFYVLLCGLNPDFLVFNPIIVANSFILVLLHQLAKSYNIQQPYSVSFNTGFLLALASLFYFPLIILFPFIWIVFLYAGVSRWRNFAISIIGLIIPYIFYFAYHFFINEFFNVIQLFRFNEKIFIEDLSLSKLSFVFYALLGIGLLALVKMMQTLQKDVIKVRKFKLVFLIMTAFIFLIGLVNGHDYISTFLLMVIPLAVFFANYFNEIKRGWLAEVLFLLLIISSIISYFS